MSMAMCWMQCPTHGIAVLSSQAVLERKAAAKRNAEHAGQVHLLFRWVPHMLQ